MPNISPTRDVFPRKLEYAKLKVEAKINALG